MRKRKKIQKSRGERIFDSTKPEPLLNIFPFLAQPRHEKSLTDLGAGRRFPQPGLPCCCQCWLGASHPPSPPSLAAMLHSHTHNEQGATPCHSFSNGNIFATNSFVSSRIDLLIHCCLIVQNAELKDANGVNVVAGTWTGAVFPISIRIS